MSRLKAGLDKLYASKAGASDAYVKDSDGAWRASGIKATGMVAPEMSRREIAVMDEFRIKVGLLEKSIHDRLANGENIIGAIELAKGREKLLEERDLKMEAVRELDKQDGGVPARIEMTLNQPYKLVVQFEDGTYRTRPFVGGEKFVAVGKKVGARGQDIVVAEPIDDTIDLDLKHGKIERIEIDMAKVGTVFDTNVPVEREMAAQKAKEAIAEKRKAAAEKAKLKKQEDEERMSQHELIGSW